MISYKTSSFANYREKVSTSIYNWTLSKEKVLNVIIPPYNDLEILSEVIIAYTQKNKKVLYITGENEESIFIQNAIKKNSSFRDYTYVRNNFVPQNSLLYICNYTNALRLKEKYDLVIYDDIHSFSEYNNYEIMDIIIKCSKPEGKVICLAVEGIFKNSRDIIIPVRSNRKPLCEPRYVITKIDLNKEIPYIIYDYLTFSVENDRKVVIFLPEAEKVRTVFEYLQNFKSSLSKNIMYYIEGESEDKLLNNFEKIRKAILVTDDYKERYEKLEDTDIIVYFADDVSFDYKKLVYFCGKGGRSDKLRSTEVIFLANSESYDMDKAKDIMRHFNKEAWERGLLNI